MIQAQSEKVYFLKLLNPDVAFDGLFIFKPVRPEPLISLTFYKIKDVYVQISIGSYVKRTLLIIVWF